MMKHASNNFPATDGEVVCLQRCLLRGVLAQVNQVLAEKKLAFMQHHF